MGLTQRIAGYRRRLLHEWTMWHHARCCRRKATRLEAWLSQVRLDPPDVFLGANFAEYGGVRVHLHAIRKHSALRIGLAPPESLMSRGFIPHDFETTFNRAFLEWPGDGIRVAHSHVFPWFVRWCHAHQERGIRWIHTYHNMYFPEFARGDLKPWQKEINEVLLTEATRADVRISVSRWQQSYLREEHGIETDYVPNGVDVGLCDAADGERFKRTREVGEYVLWVGRNDPVKNPVDFVRLAQRTAGRHFVMIGLGLSGRALVEGWDVRCPPNLSVLGALPHAEVLDAIAGCGALVITSLREGMPTLALEAMALCRPLVVANDPGCVEAIGGGDFGHIYDHGDLDNLVEQTGLALRRDDATGRARERVLDEFDWRVVAARLDCLYRG